MCVCVCLGGGGGCIGSCLLSNYCFVKYEVCHVFYNILVYVSQEVFGMRILGLSFFNGVLVYCSPYFGCDGDEGVYIPTTILKYGCERSYLWCLHARV